jgi:hypothetical protein
MERQGGRLSIAALQRRIMLLAGGRSFLAISRPKIARTVKKANKNGVISGFLRETRVCGYLATIPVTRGKLFHFVSRRFRLIRKIT